MLLFFYSTAEVANHLMKGNCFLNTLLVFQNPNIENAQLHFWFWFTFKISVYFVFYYLLLKTIKY